MATILVADDERINRRLLRAYLAQGGHEVHEAASGDEAVEIASVTPIDLALLDVVMPGVDGFEATRRIKAAHTNRFLPVILVTRLTDQPSRRLGLLAGADEFLSKPVDSEELMLRIRNLLALRDAQVHRFREEMTAMLLHDLKNPIGALLLNLELATLTVGSPDGTTALANAVSLGQRLRDLVTNMLEIQRLESAEIELDRRELDLRDLLASILASRRWQIEHQGIELDLRCSAECWTHADGELLTRVVENLLDNALRHTPAGGRIMVDAGERDDRVVLRVGNTGTPIALERRQSVFDKHDQGGTRSAPSNLGLGLYFCRLVAAAHGGRIWIEDDEELATVFVFEIPARGG
jgi:two-component system, sensor histidine kinase and response regulator